MRKPDFGSTSQHATGFRLALKFHWPVVLLASSAGLLAGALHELRRTPCFEASAAVSIHFQSDDWESALPSHGPRPASADPLRKLEATLFSELLLRDVLSGQSSESASPRAVSPAKLRDLRQRIRIESLDRRHPDNGFLLSVRAPSSSEALHLADRLAEALVASENARQRNEESTALGRLRSDLARTRSRAAELEQSLAQRSGESEIRPAANESAYDPGPSSPDEPGLRQLRLALVAENHLAHSLEAKIQRASLEAEALPSAFGIARRAETLGPLSLRHPWRSLPLGALFGAALGLLLIRLLGTRQLQRTLSERFTKLPGLKLSAVVPAGFQNSDGRHTPTTLQGQHLEPYRALRLNLRRLPAGRSLALAFHPAGSGSVVDEVLASLAPVLANGGHSVVAIDADPRHSRLHEAFTAAHHPGLSDYLAGEMRLEETVVRLQHPNLWFIPSGRATEDFGELLAGKRLPDLLAEMRARFDYVLLLSPSIREHAEAALLCSHADHTILVVDAHRDSQKDLRKSSHWLRSFDCAASGILVAHRLSLPHQAMSFAAATRGDQKRPARPQPHLAPGVDEAP